MLSVSSSLRLSVALDKENSVGQKGQVRPWHGACRTAQIREPIREVWQMVIIITVREWGHLFIILPFIYLFIYSESSTYLIRDVWQNKIPWVFPEVVKMVRKSPEFPGFPWFFQKVPFSRFSRFSLSCTNSVIDLAIKIFSWMTLGEFHDVKKHCISYPTKSLNFCKSSLFFQNKAIIADSL